MTAPPDIFDRIDAALERMRAEGVEARRIYLTEATHDEFDRAMCRRFRRKPGTAHAFSWRDLAIVRGTKDRIFSDHGVEFTIHKKLSPRVAEPSHRKAA